MNINRRELLSCVCNALIPLMSVTAANSLGAVAKRVPDSSRPLTLSHEYLLIESSVGATGADFENLDGLIRRTLSRIWPFIARINLPEIKRWEAIHVLNQIGTSLNVEHFRFGGRSTLLCTSLRTRILACHYAVCLFYSVCEAASLRPSMLKVPSHVFLRLRLGSGEDLNWDIYLIDNGIAADDNYYQNMFLIDRAAAKRAGYLSVLNRNEILAMEFNSLGVTWMIKGDANHAISNFSRAIDLDPRMSEAFKNRGCAKYRRAGINHVNELVQREDLLSAIADLQKSVEINENFEEALYSLGQAHLALSEFDAARFFLNAAEKLNPRYGNSQLSLALKRK